MINIFCPFIRDTCKGNLCVMWKDERCIIISFLESFQEELTLEEGRPKIQEELGFGSEEIPDWLAEATPEELAEEIVDFVKKEFNEDTYILNGTLIEYFWKNKGIFKFSLPPEDQLKVEKAEYLALKKLEKNRQEEYNRRLREEKEELPSLIGQCIDWAKEHNLNRVRLSDVDSFLLEKNIELLPETRRALYSMVNVRIKDKGY
ncbi:MAG: hypothetical protein QXZ28_04755 [Candidatus Methanomethylicaceae archaeon]